MNYVIEKNVSIPPSTGGRRSKYPFADMEIGDSFVAEAPATCAAHMYGRRKGLKFSAKKEGSLYRIWRIA